MFTVAPHTGYNWPHQLLEDEGQSYCHRRGRIDDGGQGAERIR